MRADRARRLLERVRELTLFHARVREEIVALMARQAPVAGDLRPVTAPLQANDRSAQLGCLAALAELVDRPVAGAAHA